MTSVPIRRRISASMLLAILVLLPSPAPGAKSARDNVLAAAEKSVGKKMWTGYGLANGQLGCAAALCNVLNQGGVSGAHSAVVTVVRHQLLDSGLAEEFTLRNGTGKEIDDEKLKQIAQPGDVVLAFMQPPSKANGGANAHCGIMGHGRDIYTNDWMDGIWKGLNIHLMFDYFPYVRILRLHERGAAKP